LAALSLSLALQECFPSPIYIFDEIDASLDITVVTKAAQYLKEISVRRSKEKGSAQFIVISLRPQFYELAPRMVGTFTLNNSSRVVSIRFDE